MSVQLTLNNRDLETLYFKSEKGKIVSNAECGPTPPGEVVIRSALCNLHCIPCFAYSYSWPEKAKTNPNVTKVSIDNLRIEFQYFLKNSHIPGNKDSYNWFRILGGEPFISERTLMAYIHFLKEISENESELFNNAILFQTNGVIIGKLDENELLGIFDIVKNKPFKIIVEMSIKGSNPKEFGIITQTKEEKAKTLYEWHVEACQKMEYVHSKVSNVDWTAVAGFGIGVTNLVAGNLNRKEYIKTFYNPETNKPFYHPECWDESFESLYKLHTKKYKEKFGDKFPMFGIEDRYNWKFALCGLRNCKKYAGTYFYDGYEVYIKKNVRRNEELENHISDIIKLYFFGDPSYYYTRLFR
jgi:uncharacterized Fe-S cluster-containing radical SAM superfamily protein